VGSGVSCHIDASNLVIDDMLAQNPTRKWN
jgi:hypothetical protein